MMNWYAIETESNYRRGEWQREVARDVRATQAITGNGVGSLRQFLSQIHLPHLGISSAPRLRFTAPLTPDRQPAVEC